MRNNSLPFEKQILGFMDVSYHPGDSYGVLEESLRDILSLLEPSARDHEIRVNIIERIATCLRSVNALKGITVKPFGSFVSNLYSKEGDLDISVQFDSSSKDSSSKKWKKILLRDIMRALKKEGVAYQIEFIPYARVPLLKFKSTYKDISCDVSINNNGGLIKSKMLLWISKIDSRFRDMVFLTKEWAKARNINDPKFGTLNSFSLCLLVIFHFQTCKPAILPPLKEIYEGNLSIDITDTSSISERNLEDYCATNIRRFKSQNYRKKNDSSLSQLLISFFQKFSNIRNVSSEYAICTHTGRWERLNSSPRWQLKQSYHILVEDPFEQAENAARSVGANQLIKISNEFQEAFRRLSSIHMCNDPKSLLAFLTRPSTSLQRELRSHLQFDAYGANNTNQFTRHGTAQNVHRFQEALRLDEHHPTSSTGSSHRIAGTRQLLESRSQLHFDAYGDNGRKFAGRGTARNDLQHLPRSDGRHPTSSTGDFNGISDTQQKWRPRLP